MFTTNRTNRIPRRGRDFIDYRDERETSPVPRPSLRLRAERFCGVFEGASTERKVRIAREEHLPIGVVNAESRHHAQFSLKVWAFRLQDERLNAPVGAKDLFYYFGRKTEKMVEILNRLPNGVAERMSYRDNIIHGACLHKLFLNMGCNFSRLESILRELCRWYASEKSGEFGGYVEEVLRGTPKLVGLPKRMSLPRKIMYIRGLAAVNRLRLPPHRLVALGRLVTVQPWFRFFSNPKEEVLVYDGKTWQVNWEKSREILDCLRKLKDHPLANKAGGAEFLRAAIVWVRHGLPAPSSWKVLSLDEKFVIGLKEKGAFSCFRRICWKYLKTADRLSAGRTTDHTVQAIAAACIVFGQKAEGYLGSDTDSWHDRAIGLPNEVDQWRELPEEAVNFLFEYRRSSIENIQASQRIIPSWGDVWKGLGSEITLVSAREYLAINAYSGIIGAVAYEAAKFEMRQADAEVFQALFMKKKLWETIPSVRATEGDYVMSKVQHDDPRGLILGLYTNCCQHPKGAGSECAEHGHSSPDGAFFVVEKGSTIVAQSWAWRNKDGDVVFDSVENTSGVDIERIARLYRCTGRSLVGRLGIKRVIVGQSNRVKFEGSERRARMPEGYDGYSDYRGAGIQIGGEL